MGFPSRMFDFMRLKKYKDINDHYMATCMVAICIHMHGCIIIAA